MYFQPPESLKMRYPAIVYSLAGMDNRYANDGVYMRSTPYTVVVIDKDPDSEVANAVSLLPLCRFDRHYVSDNLHHFAFRIIY